MLTWQSKDDKAEDLLEILNKYFRAVQFEKHPDAMLSFYLNEAHEKTIKTPHQYIRKREAKRIYNLLLEKLRSRYGPWINVTDFRIKGTQIRFRSNFARVYKTDRGLLYGQPASSAYNRVFFTSHCLERFVERVHPKSYQTLKAKMMGKHDLDPSGADVLLFTMMNRYEYAKTDGAYYLNLGVGILVFDCYEDIFVAKTFLKPEMIERESITKDLQWYMPAMDDAKFKEFSNLREALEYNNIPIKPEFFEYFDEEGDNDED